MSRVVATAANFFFPGLGYLLVGPRRVLGLCWFVAMVGLTWVELSVKTQAPDLYWPMFASVLLFNTAFAVDTWQTLGQPARVTA
jgi:hypothetical protein